MAFPSQSQVACFGDPLTSPPLCAAATLTHQLSCGPFWTRHRGGETEGTGGLSPAACDALLVGPSGGPPDLTAP